MGKAGGKDALIYGDLVVGYPLHAMAHFLIMGAGNFDEEKPIAPQLKGRKDLFKLAAQESAEAQTAMLVAFELYCFKECKPALNEFGPVLKVLWESDIVGEEQIEQWHQDERALCAFSPKQWDQDSAIAIRE